MKKPTKSLYDFCMENEDMKYLLDEWNYEENNKLELYIDKVGFGSEQNVWWKGNCGHKWEATIYNRKKGNKCPYCSGKKVLIGYNDLETSCPKLVKEWHFTKNGSLRPTMITAGSSKKVWWICEKGHEWEEKIYERKNGNNCPFCSNHRLLSGFNDLATTHPELVKEWHPTKNTLNPTEVISGNKNKFWWICEKGHEWKSDISSRKAGKCCTICSKIYSKQTSIPETMIYLTCKALFKNVYHKHKINNTEFDIYVKDLNLLVEYDGYYWHKNQREKDIKKNQIAKKNESNFIRILEYIDKTKNNTICLKTKFDLDFNISNGYKNLTKLFVEHINNIYNLNLKYIPSRNEELRAREYLKKELKENSLAIKRPDIAKEWHPTKNGILDATNFIVGSNYEAWWICDKGHEYKSIINNRTSKKVGCPYCSNKKVLFGYNDLATTNPELVKEWHPTKNRDLKPTDVVAGSGKKVWWICEKKHEYESSIWDRKKGNKCPICANRKVLTGFNDLATTHPELVKEWHPTKNRDLKPTDVVAGSNKKVWWICEYEHEWEANISRRTYSNSKCPYCSGHKVWPGYNDFPSAYPELLKYWDYEKNTIEPTKIGKASKNKYHWIDGGISYEGSINQARRKYKID